MGMKTRSKMSWKESIVVGLIALGLGLWLMYSVTGPVFLIGASFGLVIGGILAVVKGALGGIKHAKTRTTDSG